MNEVRREYEKENKLEKEYEEEQKYEVEEIEYELEKQYEVGKDIIKIKIKIILFEAFNINMINNGICI